MLVIADLMVLPGPGGAPQKRPKGFSPHAGGSMLWIDIRSAGLEPAGHASRSVRPPRGESPGVPRARKPRRVSTPRVRDAAVRDAGPDPEDSAGDELPRQ